MSWFLLIDESGHDHDAWLYTTATGLPCKS